MQSRVLHFILQNLDATGVPPTLREIAYHFGWRAVGSAQDVIGALRKKGLLEPVAPGRARQTLPTEAAYQALGVSPRAGLLARSGATKNTALATLRSGSEPIVQTLWDAAEPGAADTAVATQVVSDARRSSSSLAPKKFLDTRVTLDAPVEDPLLAAAIADAVVLPLLGRVRAGHPAEAIEQPDGRVTLPRHPAMRSNRKALFYAVEVEGYSMIGAGMLPGDLLMIETTSQAKSGDITLAAVGPDQEVTVKRFAPKGSPLYRLALARTPYGQQNKESWPPALLVPENEDFDPLAFGLEPTDRVVGLVRSLFRPELR